MGSKTSDNRGVSATALAEQRLDMWLDVACLFKTRSEAQQACRGGKVDLNQEAAKPHRQVRPGDEVRITRLPGRKQIVVVRGLSERHVPKAAARELYQDTTPPPTPEEVEMREMERLFRAGNRPRIGGAPDKRDRRAIRRLRGR
jgi:ribosome-associated heat shock protein Hsp15